MRNVSILAMYSVQCTGTLRNSTRGLDDRRKRGGKGWDCSGVDDVMTKCPRTFFPGRNVLCIFLVFSALIVADPCVVLTLYRIQAVENLVETWVSPEALRATGGNPKASLSLPNKWIANPSQHNIRPPPPIRDGSYKYTARDTSPKRRIVQGKKRSRTPRSGSD
jgi:hypothetical protein